jgi:hypothetical protein
MRPCAYRCWPRPAGRCPQCSRIRPQAGAAPRTNSWRAVSFCTTEYLMGRSSTAEHRSPTPRMGVRILPAQRSGTLRGESARILRIPQWETPSAACGPRVFRSQAARALRRPGPAHGLLAQLGERRSCKPEVWGSSPQWSTHAAGCRVRVSAPRPGRGRRGSSPCFPTDASLVKSESRAVEAR